MNARIDSIFLRCYQSANLRVVFKISSFSCLNSPPLQIQSGQPKFVY